MSERIDGLEEWFELSRCSARSYSLISTRGAVPVASATPDDEMLKCRVGVAIAKYLSDRGQTGIEQRIVSNYQPKLVS